MRAPGKGETVNQLPSTTEGVCAEGTKPTYPQSHAI